MALSRQRSETLPLVATTSNFCRFCAKEAIGRKFLDLRSNEKFYTTTINRLQYMNINPSKKLNMNICKSCYGSFNVAYKFCLTYNHAQIKLSSIDAVGEENAERAEMHGPPKRVLENIKTELESADEIDIENVDEFSPPCNKRKKHIVDSNKSWHSYSWTCCHCDAEFKELAELRSHSKKKHLICFAFECPDCDIMLNEYTSFIEHVRNHKENLRFYCDICNKPIDETIHHDHESGRAMCRFCGDILPDDASRLLHYKTYEKRHITDYLIGKKERYVITIPDLQFGTVFPDCDVFHSWKDYVWVCKLCEIKFHSARALRQHGEMVHDTCCIMKCLDCNETADSFHMLVLHITRHRPSLRHFCPFCNRLAHSDDLFRAHVRDHLTNSSYCPECGENYPNRITEECRGDITSVYWFLEPAARHASSRQLIETSQTTEFVNEAVEESEGEDDDDDDIDEENEGDDEEEEEAEEEEAEKEEMEEEEAEEQEESDTEEEDEKTGKEAEGDGEEQEKKGEGENAINVGVAFNVNEYVDYRLPYPKSCKSCDETFKDKRLYREHTNTSYCPICDKMFNCIVYRENHIFSRHMAEKPYECYKCGRCYRYRNRAYECMESHLSAEMKMCNICRSMVLASFLKEHVEAHKYDCGHIEKSCGYGYCTLKFASWIERVNHRHSKHLAITYRKVRCCGRYLTQKNILGLLPETGNLPIEFK